MYSKKQFASALNFTGRSPAAIFDLSALPNLKTSKVDN